ncbi:MAG: ribose 5-phosphate isomerase B [bacterium]
MSRRFALASDHAGLRVKEEAKAILCGMGHQVLDFGTDSEASVDYPDYARKAVEAVLGGRAEQAVLVCGSGVGMSIVANKFPGIRAALVAEPRAAEMCRKHNDANVLVLPGWRLERAEVAAILEAWLRAEFEGGRHQRRVEKIGAIEREVRQATAGSPRSEER